MPRNVVICLDGTRNEPETGSTNVIRTFVIATKDEKQLVYYDPGVGTLGARSATTRFGKFLTRVAGLVLGHGIKDNLEEAYRFLIQNYRADDRIFIFGFSRGAYTALALAGMLRTVGLVRAEADNLIPYAMKLYAKSGRSDPSEAEEKEFWRPRTWFNTNFGSPQFPHRFAHQIHFLGIWDAVKTVGWFNWRAKLQQARWPFTRKIPNVRYCRHALAIDEKRRPYGEYRLNREQVANSEGRLREMWFVGVHSDVGGTFMDDPRLADISLQWILDEAIAQGLTVDAAAYKKELKVAPGESLPLDYCLGKVHDNQIGWALIGLGWHHRVIEVGDAVHQSVRQRMETAKNLSPPYEPKLP